MTDFTQRLKSPAVGFASLFGFFLLWKAGSLIMDSSIILPSPEETLRESIVLFGSSAFWTSVAATVFRGLAGFFLSFASGIIIGLPAGRYPLFLRFVRPYITVIQSTPVLAIILLALIWFPTEAVPVFVAFLMGFPIITLNLVEGMRSVDPGLLAMSRVYRVGRMRRLSGLVFPSVLPFLASGISSALGLSWRVVVAAEVLSQPLYGLGTGLQEAKMRLETPRVFAWTLTALIISWLTDSLFSRFIKHLRRRQPL